MRTGREDTDIKTKSKTNAESGSTDSSLLAALAATLLLALGTTGAGAQEAPQSGVSFNVRGGVYVPTMDIADAADAGPGFGVGLKVPVSDRVFLRAAGDFGFHSGAETNGVEGPDVSVYHYHYIGGLGVRLTPVDSRFYASVNGGAGAMTFDIDGVDSFTYFAINVGGALGYWMSDRVALFVSPQGDIATYLLLTPPAPHNTY